MDNEMKQIMDTFNGMKFKECLDKISLRLPIANDAKELEDLTALRELCFIGMDHPEIENVRDLLYFINKLEGYTMDNGQFSYTNYQERVRKDMDSAYKKVPNVIEIEDELDGLKLIVGELVEMNRVNRKFEKLRTKENRVDEKNAGEIYELFKRIDFLASFIVIFMTSVVFFSGICLFLPMENFQVALRHFSAGFIGVAIGFLFRLPDWLKKAKDIKPSDCSSPYNHVQVSGTKINMKEK